eukprot:UC4_evm3s209
MRKNPVYGPVQPHQMPKLFALLAFSIPACKAAQNKSVGILYEVWHAKAATAMHKVLAQGGAPLTTELVIQSNGNLTLNDVYGPYGINADIFNVQPDLGFYCLYRRRPNDTHPPIPDCPNITQTATQHAKLLVDMGVDYIAVDITNWPQVNLETDVAVLRPLEVLLEEWGKLRANGVPTPYISVWPVSPVGIYPDGHATTWQWLLDNVYNNPSTQDLVWKRPNNGNKFTIFVPDNSNLNDTVNALIESNGGRNNVEVVKMWALFGEKNYEKGSWGFFSPCTTSTGRYTTSMIGEQTCNQFQSADPTIPNQILEISASGGYMLSQCALPFASPGHMRGLTLQRLFKSVLEESPPNLFLSSFNEHIGGRQKSVYKAAMAINMGLPNDPQKDEVWVDTYASEFSRDIEPTVEGGSRVYEVASSCVALYKSGATCENFETEACCTTTDKYIWNNVWSLILNSDHLLTKDSNERNILVKEGWTEVCNAVGGPSVFCVDPSLTDGRNGPFMLYSIAEAISDTIPLYRCNNRSLGFHFFSTAADCEGQITESQIGWMSPNRGKETLRGLSRCRFPDGSYTHALDLPCPTGTTADPISPLGFVR